MHDSVSDLMLGEKPMNHTLTISGFEGQTIEMRTSPITGPRLLVNGQPAPKGKKRGEMLLRRNDGTEVVATWKPMLLGLDTPQLNVSGQMIAAVKPLTWYEWLWSALPVLLVFIGGLLGAIAGMIAVTINARIFRSSLPMVLRYILTGVVSIVAVVVYLITVSLLLTAVGR
jgi:hypothetical protein